MNTKIVISIYKDQHTTKLIWTFSKYIKYKTNIDDFFIKNLIKSIRHQKRKRSTIVNRNWTDKEVISKKKINSIGWKKSWRIELQIN